MKVNNNNNSCERLHHSENNSLNMNFFVTFDGIKPQSVLKVGKFRVYSSKTLDIIV